jgi:CelD/BcsL family acetyltransferase involved in cellulose biosynthesis
MSRIRVDICSSSLSIADEWRDLVTRASGNVFLDPAALNVVYATNFATLHTLLAWERTGAAERLVGVWALRESRLSPLGPTVLAAPPYEYSFVSNPVVDPALVDAVIPALFATIESNRALPNVVHLRNLDGDSPTSVAILRALNSRGSPQVTLAERARPFVSRESGLKLSGSTHKKLRQDWNRLSALGAVEIVNDRTPREVQDAFEVFLAMELASWKGKRGTALLCKETDAAFTRKLVASLVAEQKASVALLRVDGRPIAAQVLLYSGTMAYTWKTAFDATYGKYSPGSLLIDRVTPHLFSNGIDAIESCSLEAGFMAQLWAGRRATIDLLANVGARRSLTFTVAAIREWGYAELKSLRDRWRAVQWPPLPTTQPHTAFTRPGVSRLLRSR